MKKAIIFLAFLALLAMPMMAQDKSTIIVKKTGLSNGVVIVTVTQQATANQAKPTSFELQCNQGAGDCRAPEPGTYLMVRLPKNWGMYDCANVDLYATSANPDTDQKIGEYCLMEK